MSKKKTQTTILASLIFGVMLGCAVPQKINDTPDIVYDEVIVVEVEEDVVVEEVVEEEVVLEPIEITETEDEVVVEEVVEEPTVSEEIVEKKTNDSPGLFFNIGLMIAIVVFMWLALRKRR